VSIHSTIRGLAVVASTTLLMTISGVQSASAAIVLSERFSDSGTEIVDECGYTDLVYSFEVSGSVRIVQRQPDGPEMFSLTGRSRESWTNDAGVTLTVQGTLLDKDLKLTDNGDGTTTLIVLLTGGFHSRGPNGVISADPGQTRLALTFGATGNLIDEEVVKGSTGRSDDGSLCGDMTVAFG
jgi:hypothetical protein